MSLKPEEISNSNNNSNKGNRNNNNNNRNNNSNSNHTSQYPEYAESYTQYRKLFSQISEYVVSKPTKGKRETLDKKWQDEVVKYRDRIFYCYKGRNIYTALLVAGFDFSEVSKRDVVSLVSALIYCLKDSNKDLVDNAVYMPATSIWGLTSPYKGSIYKTHGRVKQYQASTIFKALDALDQQDIIYHARYENGLKYSRSKCRRLCLTERFVMAYKQVITQTFFDSLMGIEIPEGYRMKPAKKGTGFTSHTPKKTNQLVKKLQKCQFRFNTDALDTEVIADIKGIEDNAPLCENLIQNLSTMNIFTDEPQYFSSFHLQESGRLHTNGGSMFLSKEFRKLFIKPVDPNNMMVEIDLASAQLFMLSEILGVPDVEQNIRTFLSSSVDNSLWQFIASHNKDLPKPVKKTILYSFCFGAQEKDIPNIVNTKLKGISNKINYTCKKKDVDDVLHKSFLAPLVEARNVWMENFTLDKILSGDTPKKCSNDIGLTFKLYDEAVEYSKQSRTSKYKIAGRLLAFLAQGAEQNIVQDILKDLPYNILCFQYDGATIECPAGEYGTGFIHMFNTINNKSRYPISYEIL